MLNEVFRSTVPVNESTAAMWPVDAPVPYPEADPTRPLICPFPPETWPGDPDEAPEPPTSWVWEGYLASGNVTLLTSQWKLGKTTLLSVLLARLKTGGELAGLPVTAGKALVVSEESRSLWRRRQSRLDFGKSVCLLSQPFLVKPSMGP